MAAKRKKSRARPAKSKAAAKKRTAAAKAGARKKAAKRTTKKRSLKASAVKTVKASRLIVTKDADKADGTDKKTDPKVGNQADSDFRNHGDPKR